VLEIYCFLRLQGQFYAKEKFLQYNMFNNYFFNTVRGPDRLREFVCDGEADKVLLVCDPPFGGLVNVLAKNFKDIWKLGNLTLQHLT